MMLTRLELDGFKTFQDFKIEFAPFQVIVGPNGAGKSNLFDALRLLAKLADSDLRSAFLELRGEANELFTILPDGRPTNRMRLAVEMLVERHVEDDWGVQLDLKYTRLRYELEIAHSTNERGLDRLYVAHEVLVPIVRSMDPWINCIDKKYRDFWVPFVEGKDRGSTPFLSTQVRDEQATTYMLGDGLTNQPRVLTVATDRIERTFLSRVTNVDFPHAFAAREEMRMWQFLHLNPTNLRQPDEILLLTSQPSMESDGSGLPSVLARIQAETPFLLNDISSDLANLVPGIVGVDVEKDEGRNQYLIRIKTQDGRSFSSRVLSDGTLRLLALVTLKNDPYHHGLLCFEEPENGVHPFRLKKLVSLLRDLTTDFSDPAEADEPLRQLLVNTHSPVLVSHPDVLPNLLFAQLATRVEPKQGPSMQVTRMTPVNVSPPSKADLGIGNQEETYTVDQIIAYLNSAAATEALATLQRSNGR